MMPHNDFVSECAIFLTALVICIIANIIGLISIGELKFKPNFTQVTKFLAILMRAESNRPDAYQPTSANENVEKPKESKRKNLSKLIQNYKNKTKAKAKRMKERLGRRRNRDRNRYRGRREDRDRDRREDRSGDRRDDRSRDRRDDRSRDRREDRSMHRGEERGRQEYNRDIYRDESNDSVGYEEPSDIWMAENYLKQWRETQDDNESRKTLAMNWRRSQLRRSMMDRKPNNL